MSKSENTTRRWYAEEGQFAAVCDNVGTGVHLIPRWHSSDADGGSIYLSPGCLSLAEWDSAIDQMIRTLQDIRRKGATIMASYDQDYHAAYRIRHASQAERG